MSQSLELAMARVAPGPKRIVAAVDRFNTGVGKLTSWLAIPMMLSVMYEVIMRNVFTAPSIWAMDMAMILYAIHFMLGSPYCLLTGNHIRTDFFYHSWSVRTKAAVDLANYIIFFFPAHLVFLYIGHRVCLEVFHPERGFRHQSVDARHLARQNGYSGMCGADPAAGHL